MSWRATEPLPTPASAFTSGAVDDEGNRRASESPPEPRPRPIRASTYRFRRQLPPWRIMIALPPLGAALHLLPVPMWMRMLGVLAAGGLFGWWQWARQTRADHRAYTIACAAAGTAWLLYVTRLGMVSGPGRFSGLLLLAGWAPLSWLWWDRHRIRGGTDTPAVEPEPTDPFVQDWQAQVEPEMHWTLSDPQQIDAGTSYRLQLVPGQAIEDAEQAKKKVASLLRISRTRITFESRSSDVPGVVDDESVITMIVTPKLNPQHLEAQPWQGPSLDRATGLYQHGVYPDGPAYGRMYRVEGGRPHRAVNSLFSGTTGSGKSRGSAIKIAEQVRSGMFVTWYGDGKGGASAPELEASVDWYADHLTEVLKMLRAGWRVMKVRAKKIKQLHQEAFRGRRVIWLGDRAFPFLQIVLDEAQEFLKHHVVARLVKALLRMGNEVGIGVDLLTQVPLLSELGAASGETGVEVIRAMAKSGNVVVYRADDTFTGRVTLTSELSVNPHELPRGVQGACYMAGHVARAAVCRTFYASKETLYAMLADTPVMALDAASARAAGEDYATRHQRAKDAEVDPEEIDLGDLDAELAVLLGERLPGQDAPGATADKFTVKQAVFEAVKSADGPIKRDQIAVALAARGLTPSKSAVDQALTWWCERDHLVRTAHGVYELVNREGTEAASTVGAVPQGAV